MRLAVHSATGTQHFDVAEHQSVREVLDETDLRVRAACGGSGTCGACIVTLVSGETSPPTLAEYMKLSVDERADGLRLACQLRLRGDVEIRLDQPAPPSQWKAIVSENLLPDSLLATSIANTEAHAHPYGLAVDLGTTHIRISLWDRQRGRRIASRVGPNPQGEFGADVLNRLESALRSTQHGTRMATLARTAIVQALRDILARDVGEVTPMLAQIGRVVIVGNTAMIALLTEQGAAQLLDPANWQQAIDCSRHETADWKAQWYMPNANIIICPPVAGFIGSDLKILVPLLILLVVLMFRPGGLMGAARERVV